MINLKIYFIQNLHLTIIFVLCRIMIRLMFKNQTCIDSFIESLKMFESDMFNIKVIENKTTQVEMQERTASNFILFS